MVCVPAGCTVTWAITDDGLVVSFSVKNKLCWVFCYYSGGIVLVQVVTVILFAASYNSNVKR